MSEIRIVVRVKPGASRARVGGAYGEGELVVSVNAQPVDGAANEAVRKAVAAALGVRPSRVRVVSGHTSRTKVLAIEIDDGDAAALTAAIDTLRSASSPRQDE